jgi:DeoR family transcriptional regulator, fructose operon transcriptional repressor
VQSRQTGEINGVRSALPSVRRQSIVNEIIRRHTVTITDLARQFGVSEMTIRRDLHELEKTGLIESVHGGAKSASLSPFELSYAQREMMEREAKRAIGHAAATLVEHGDVIALDGSTTTLQLARNLVDRGNLTVYTNGIKVATELAHRPGIRIILTGGELYHSVSLVGLFARSIFEKIRVDRLFLSVTGITEDLGLSGPSDVDADVKAAMIAAAAQVVLVADHTKFGRRSYVRVAPLSAVHVVVTDERCPPDFLQMLSARGIRTIVAPLDEQNVLPT